MTFFGEDVLAVTAARNPAFKQATIGEAMSAAWESQKELRNSDSIQQALSDHYEQLRRQIETQTGKRLFNPWKSLPVTDFNIGGDEMARQFEGKFWTEVEKLRPDFPDLPIESASSIREKIAQEREEIRIRTGEVSARALGTMTTVGEFAATAGAALTDPPVFGSMVVGAPWATGLLRAVLIEAGIGIASETIVQTQVQMARQEVGEEPDPSEAALSILAAGAGGAALGGLIRGGVKGTQALLARSRSLPSRLRTADVRGAEQLLSILEEAEASNPFPQTRAGRTAHFDALEEAINRLRHTETETAVGRVLGAREPIRVEVEVRPRVRGETLEDFTARIESENPELFRRLSAVFREVDEATAAIAEIDARLGEPTALPAAAQQRAALQEQLEAATDPRRIKRLKRQIADLEQREGKSIARRAAAQKGQRTKLTKQQARLKKRVTALRKEGRKLTERVDRVIQDATAETSTASVARIKVLSPGDDPVSIAARSAADLGGVTRTVVARMADDGGPTSGGAGSPVVREGLIPETASRIAAREQTVEAQTLTAIEADPEMRVFMVDDDGNVSEMSGRELLDDFADDDVLLRELQDCVKDALI